MVSVYGEWEACVRRTGSCGARVCVTERFWILRCSGTRESAVRSEGAPTARAVKGSREKCVRANCIRVNGEDGTDHTLYTQACSCGNHHPDFLFMRACVCARWTSNNECPVVRARTARSRRNYDAYPTQLLAWAQRLPRRCLQKRRGRHKLLRYVR